MQPDAPEARPLAGGKAAPPPALAPGIEVGVRGYRPLVGTSWSPTVPIHFISTANLYIRYCAGRGRPDQMGVLRR